MPNAKLKVGEIEAILDLLMAIEKKGQWLAKLQKEESAHAKYFSRGLQKSIQMFSEGLPLQSEKFEEKK